MPILLVKPISHPLHHCRGCSIQQATKRLWYMHDCGIKFTSRDLVKAVSGDHHLRYQTVKFLLDHGATIDLHVVRFCELEAHELVGPSWDGEWPPPREEMREQKLYANDTVIARIILASRFKESLTPQAVHRMAVSPTVGMGECYYGPKYLVRLLSKVAEGKVPVPTEPMSFRQLAGDVSLWLETDRAWDERGVGEEADPRDDTEPGFRWQIAPMRPIEDEDEDEDEYENEDELDDEE
jgi:hypothetical protein